MRATSVDPLSFPLPSRSTGGIIILGVSRLRKRYIIKYRSDDRTRRDLRIRRRRRNSLVRNWGFGRNSQAKVLV